MGLEPQEFTSASLARSHEVVRPPTYFQVLTVFLVGTPLRPVQLVAEPDDYLVGPGRLLVPLRGLFVGFPRLVAVLRDTVDSLVGLLGFLVPFAGLCLCIVELVAYLGDFPTGGKEALVCPASLQKSPGHGRGYHRGHCKAFFSESGSSYFLLFPWSGSAGDSVDAGPLVSRT